MKLWQKLVLILVALVVVAFLGISVFLGNTMTTPKRVPIEGSPALFGLEFEDISFSSADDELTLRGWYLPVEDSEQIIIIVHGVDSNRADTTIGLLDIASGLVEHGYSVLMFDLRGHGESDGNRVSAGYYERNDLAGAVDYVKGRGFESIGVLGFSMGAATAIMTTAENDDIDALVADSSYSNMQDMIGPEFSKRTKFPKFFLPPILFIVKIIYGVDFVAVKPIEYIPDISPRPIFLIYGEQDERVPVEHAYRMQEASKNPQTELWVLPDVGHVKAYTTHPEEYMIRITAFFDSSLQ